MVAEVVRVEEEFPSVVLPLNTLDPENVLLSERWLDDAAVMVKVPPSDALMPLRVSAPPPCRRLLPSVLVATTVPFAFTASREWDRLVMAKPLEDALLSVVLPATTSVPAPVLSAPIPMPPVK